MQSKINAFFKSTTSDSSSASLDIWENQQHHIINTYTRRRPKLNAVIPSVVKNKKRSYAQFHLDFGQSDFLLRACSTCRFKFTPRLSQILHPGDSIQSWTKENVFPPPSVETGRIILVSENDLTSHRKKC
ncbi:hypothetical protein JHK85_008265 [Glycine max]|nr:hypothetical protein JHK85_008265 [Glycine max]KAG5072814.1 hypothetical protein JHK86_008025 [Glycine max]